MKISWKLRDLRRRYNVCWRSIRLLWLAALVAIASSAPQAFGLPGNAYPLSLPEGAYRSFKLSDQLKKELAANDRIRLRVKNPGSKSALFFLVFEDNQSHDYWSRLNFKTTLAPGVNDLSFDLRREVGERGSKRDTRQIDYRQLKKMYAVINPEQTPEGVRGITIQSAQLSKAEELEIPKGVLVFDFAGRGAPAMDLPGAAVVTEKTLWSPERGHGFGHLELWRTRSAEKQPARLSSSLGALNASFKVALAPGKYRYQLIWDELGYWEPPFWKERSFSVNGKLAKKQTRPMYRDFIKDYLAMMEEPKQGSDVYSHYFKKAFTPVEGSFASVDGGALFNFAGDPSGASLNSLVIWPEEKDSVAREFLERLDAVERESFSQNHRLIRPPARKEAGAGPALKASAAPLGNNFRPQDNCSGEAAIEFSAAKEDWAHAYLCVNADTAAPLSYEIEPFTKGKETLSEESLQLSLLSYRPKSIDLNHETYEWRAESASELEHPSIPLNGYSTRYLHLRVSLKGASPGLYSGKIVFEQEGKKAQVKLSLAVLSASYPELPINIGFIGLAPMPETYFEASEKKAWELKWRLNALEKLTEAGFSLFTGAPAPEIRYTGAARSNFILDSEAFDQFAAKAPGNELFMYGESFPLDLFSGRHRNAGQTENSFWKNLSEELQKLAAKHAPKELVFLYSDEATGYRNAVEEDLKAIAEYKKIFPALKLGGFGNLATWESGKKLYQKWDYGLYADIPSRREMEMLKQLGQETGLYNLCAAPGADLEFCFGPQAFVMGKAGVARYFEWHASAVHNYPGFDLDGRESDIALFYPELNNKVSVTKRFLDASIGAQTARKLFMLDRHLKSSANPDEAEAAAKKWLNKIENQQAFPVKSFRQRYQKVWRAKDSVELERHLRALFLP